MRIRLRVPPEDDLRSESRKTRGGLLNEFLGFFGQTPPAPAQPAPQFDKRWLSRGKIRYFFAGRHCLPDGGDWRSEYVFDVYADGRPHLMRIILPESHAGRWESSRGQRLSEASRYAWVRTTVEALLDERRFPPSVTVTAAEVESVG